jgi:hypothetical protein
MATTGRSAFGSIEREELGLKLAGTTSSKCFRPTADHHIDSPRLLCFSPASAPAGRPVTNVSTAAVCLLLLRAVYAVQAIGYP